MANDQITTLYLADDHQIVIDGLQLLISNEINYKIIGTAIDGNKAHNEILSKKPDIALVDIKMPGMNGIDLISTLIKVVKTRFIILSMYSDRRYITDAHSYGACGYLLKNIGRKELLKCIDRVMAGEKYFPQQLITENKKAGTIFTPRELDILKMIISEQTTQQISDELHLSHYTVETHRKNICRKANTKTAVGLLRFISENNIVL